jgi:phage gpG-like protein
VLIENEDEFIDAVGHDLAKRVLDRLLQKGNCPYKTGRLWHSLTYDKDNEGYYIYSDLPYAARVEYGFIGKDSLGRWFNQTGQFFVHKAIRYVLGE